MSIADVSLSDATSFSLILFLAVSLLSYFLGGVVKGSLGLGMPITTVSTMSFVADARTAVLLVLMPVVIINLWQIICSGQVIEVFKRYWLLTVSLTVFLLITAEIAVEVPKSFILSSVGIAVILFAGLNLWIRIPGIPRRFDSAAQLATGVTAGALGGMTGLIVVPIVAYFSACNLTKDAFIASTSPFFLLGGCLLIYSYGNSGVFDLKVAFFSTLLAIPAVVGLIAGEQIRRRVSGAHFKRLVLIVFFIMGINMIVKGLGF